MNKFLKYAHNVSKKDKLFTSSNLIVITITFVLFQLFLTIGILSQTGLKKLEKEALLTVFFKDDFTEDQILELKTQIEQNPKVYEVKYVSKDDAFNIFKDLNKDEPLLLESISASVLPASLEIKAKRAGNLSALAEEYSKVDGVEGVKYFKDIVENFAKWSLVILATLGVVFLLFAFVSFSMVVTTIKNAVFQRKTEFEILKLVGASDDYIKKPLLAQGFYYGLLSAIFANAVGILLFAILALTGFFGKIGFTSLNYLGNIGFSYLALPLVLIVTTTISSIATNLLSAAFAVKRFLKY